MLVDECGEGEGVFVNGRIVGILVGVVVLVVDCEVVEVFVVIEFEVVGSGVFDFVVVVEVCEVIVGVVFVVVVVVVVDEKLVWYCFGIFGIFVYWLFVWLKVYGVL